MGSVGILILIPIESCPLGKKGHCACHRNYFSLGLTHSKQSWSCLSLQPDQTDHWWDLRDELEEVEEGQCSREPTTCSWTRSPQIPSGTEELYRVCYTFKGSNPELSNIQRHCLACLGSFCICRLPCSPRHPNWTQPASNLRHAHLRNPKTFAKHCTHPQNSPWFRARGDPAVETEIFAYP